VSVADKRYALHILVALAFCLPKASCDNVVEHCDDSKSNNHVRNLKWGTTASNNNAVLKSGTRKSHARAKSIPLKGWKIDNPTSSQYFESAADAARQLSLDEANIRNNSVGKLGPVGGFQFERLLDDSNLPGEVWVPLIVPVQRPTITFQPTDPERAYTIERF